MKDGQARAALLTATGSDRWHGCIQRSYISYIIVSAKSLVANPVLETLSGFAKPTNSTGGDAERVCSP